MRPIRTVCLAAIVGVLVVLGLSAPAASASSLHHPRGTAGQHPRLSGAHPNTASTFYGAGYFSYPAVGDVASVSVTFTVPTIRCSKTTDEEWLLPGIWVYGTPSGNLTEQVDVNLLCDQGSIIMFDVICLEGGTCSPEMPINAGDRIVASLSETTVQTFGSIRDITTGQTDSATGAATPNSDNSVLIGDTGPSQFGATKVPKFNTVPFSKAQVNGRYLSDWTPARYNLVTTGSVIQIKAGLLTGDGDAFNTTFAHN